MTVEYVNVNGDPINWRSQALSAKKKAPAAPSAPKAMGFRVVGLRAGAIDDAREQHLRFAKENPAKAKPWDEAAWLRNAKRERISPRNYEIRGAAETLAEMAKRQGWTHVAVEEVTRGDVEGARQKIGAL